MTPQFGLLMDGCFVPFYFVRLQIFELNKLATQIEHYSVMYAFLPLTGISYFFIILLLVMVNLRRKLFDQPNGLNKIFDLILIFKISNLKYLWLNDRDELIKERINGID